MKKTTLLLLFTFAFVFGKAQTKQQVIDNETAFTKLYGYVHYFYPGDEAASINWEHFAIYGSKKVAICTNRQSLKQTLTELFHPIAPTLQLADSAENIAFNKQSVMPPSLNGYKTVAWQHIGVRARPLNYKGDPYQSARTNRKIYLDDYNNNKFGTAAKSLDITTYRNKEFILTGRAKMNGGTGSGRLWARVDKQDKAMGFFNNMNDSPIINTEWKSFEIKGIVDSNAQQLSFGPALSGTGEFWIDDLCVAVKIGNGWEKVYDNNFNSEKTGITTRYVLGYLPVVKVKNPDFIYNIVEDAKKPGEKWLSIKSTAKTEEKKHTVLFKDYPQVGEYITKDIGCGLKIIMPISLYGDNDHTYPVADGAEFANLKGDLNNLSVNTADSLDTRFGDLAIIWNVFQHFFPYLDISKTNWTQDLRIAFSNALTDKDSYDFTGTLQKLTANLKDEHIVVSWAKDQKAFFPGITWEWIENKLVVTKVFATKRLLERGDVITAIDNETPENYFKNEEQYIAAATPGGLINQAESRTLLGIRKTAMQFSFLNRDNVPKQGTLVRNFGYQDHYKELSLTDSANSIRHVGENIMYINIGVANMKAINKALPQLKKCKAIICDLRNDMIDNDNNHFIEYLLTQKDTAKHWFYTAHIIYPDQENIRGYDMEGWELVPAKPHLDAKIIFLVDGSDYSWAESYMSIIAHYKLATIIGQPTAGTNGDVNQLLLPGSYGISFSGLKVMQLDGSQHQGVGTKPNIYVTKTIKGVRDGKDEFLEKAIEVATAAVQ